MNGNSEKPIEGGARNDAPGGEPVSPPTVAKTSAKWRWISALVAGLLAGVVAWLGGEAFRGMFDPEMVDPYDPAYGTLPERQDAAERLESLLVFGMLGGILGLAMGAAGGVARRSPRGGAIAAGVGLVLGVVAGAGASWGLIQVYQEIDLDRASTDLLVPLLIHGTIWSAVGAAAGLAFGIGLGGRGQAVRCLLGGLLGAVLGTVLADVLGAVLFPIAETYRPISVTWISRLFMRLSVTVMVALFAAASVAEGKGEKATARIKGANGE